MNEAACQIIDFLGGPPEVARMTKAPLTTVHSWRRVGLSEARLDHLKLAAEREGKSIAHLVDQPTELAGAAATRRAASEREAA